MLRIRLTRCGKINQVFYRIVVAEAKRPIKGRFIEILGFLNPHTKEISLKKERIQYWLSVGAKPSDTMHNLLVDHKLIQEKKINKFKNKKKSAEEKEATQSPEEQKTNQDQVITEEKKAKKPVEKTEEKILKQEKKLEKKEEGKEKPEKTETNKPTQP